MKKQAQLYLKYYSELALKVEKAKQGLKKVRGNKGGGHILDRQPLEKSAFGKVSCTLSIKTTRELRQNILFSFSLCSLSILALCILPR